MIPPLAAMLIAMLTACGTSATPEARTVGPHAIVLDRGIAGITLNMTGTGVRTHLGTPDSIKSISVGENGDSATVWRYQRRHLTVQLAASQVTRVETDSRAYRTADGLGVGSSQKVVEGKLKLHCSHVDTNIWCTTAGGSIGDPQTVFVVRGGRVGRVRVVTITP